ncbi:MAG: Formaldehyde-activating enzyme [Candidatus Methanolliviera sp. GoM_asphalt]|nr:MAG: Formaldehyde-activating enzyme [Candidatus Methanolliviera sp. GoM_asphalt]
MIVNKVTIKGAEQVVLMFGPAQAAVAKAVADCVEDGTIPKEEAEDLLIIVSVFIQWNAKDKKKIYDYNYEATKLSIKRALSGEPTVGDVLAKKETAKLAKKETAKHPFA